MQALQDKLRAKLARNVATLLIGLLLSGLAQATTYVLPKGDVVGQIQFARIKASETLIDIARRYDVGFNAIKAANPHIDAWLPREGQKVVIPSRYILPKGPRRGIVINRADMNLYHYTQPELGPPLVSIYPVSIGQQGKATRVGNYTVQRRVRKPTWIPTAATRRKYGGLPAEVPPGRKNPLGEYAMILDRAGYMIHGTNRPYSIGMKVDQGWVRLYPEDMEVLIHRTDSQTPVRIVDESFKYGYKDGSLYFELHKPEGAGNINLAGLVNRVTGIVPYQFWAADWQRVRYVGEHATGVATPVARVKPAKKRWQGSWLQVATYRSYDRARTLILQLEEMNVPVTVRDCETGKCRVLAGPFRDQEYIEALRKRIKWITRIKAYPVRYEEEDDWEMDPVEQVKPVIAAS